MRKIFFISFPLLIGLILSACARMAPPQDVEKERDLMGTVVSVQTYGVEQEKAGQAIELAFSRVKDLENQAHPDRPGSDLFQINQNAGVKPTAVHPDIFEIIKMAQKVSQDSNGGFDVTFAGVGHLWNFKSESPSIPSDEELQKALALIDYRRMQVEDDNKTIYLPMPGMRINLGAIAKGWAADNAARALHENGVANAIINAGGDMVILGSKNGSPWRIGVQHPRKPHGELYAVLEVMGDVAVATSGDYERFFIKDGIRYHHILDAHTGRPARLCQSVTIIAQNGALADALATAVFVLGPEEGMAMLHNHYPQCDTLIIDAEGNEHASSRFYQRTNCQKAEQ